MEQILVDREPEVAFHDDRFTQDSGQPRIAGRQEGR